MSKFALKLNNGDPAVLHSASRDWVPIADLGLCTLWRANKAESERDAALDREMKLERERDEARAEVAEVARVMSGDHSTPMRAFAYEVSAVVKSHATLLKQRDEALDRAERAEAQVASLREVLHTMTMWLSRWRHAVIIRAEGAPQAWDELERAHNDGVRALAAEVKP